MWAATSTKAAMKSERPILFSGGINVPVFTDDELQIENKGYQLLAAISHSGTDEAGHCRALLKTWPTVHPEPVSFLLIDDDQPPQRVWEEPEWFKRDVMCFWLCDCAHLDLFHLPDDLQHDTAVIQPPLSPEPAAEMDPDQESLMRLIGTMPT